MKKLWLTGVVLAAIMAGSAANAAVTVVGNGFARGCYVAALHEERTSDAMSTCNQAIDNQPLDRRNRAATFVNRGIIHLNRNEDSLALNDFNRAIELQPQLAEAHTNRAAALLYMGQYNEAVAAADHGLQLQPTEPHKAYFIRGAANEELGNASAAYRDYRRASELAPDWRPARTELTRFRVR